MMNTDEQGLAAKQLDQMTDITEKVIGCAYKVSNTLGCGFLEKIYENALVYELKKIGLKTTQQHAVSVSYEDIIVGEYVADLLVGDRLLVELKAVENLSTVHSAQCLNYLKATGLKVCLLINFGQPKVEVKRLVNHLDRK